MTHVSDGEYGIENLALAAVMIPYECSLVFSTDNSEN